MKACDFPGARRIGAPANWDAELDGAVGTIFVTDAVDVLSGQNFMYSVYQPTPRICEQADLRPMWDMGEPI